MAPRVTKLNLWFKHFTNESCRATFLNRKESARYAGYKTNNEDSLRQIGCQNFTKLTDQIEKWLDEAGLSENALKIKLISLMDAKETKFFQKDGEVTDQREVEAIETQRRALDMALKIKGLYAPDKREVAIGISSETLQKLLSSLPSDYADKVRAALVNDEK